MANYEAWTRLGGCLTGVRCGVWHLTRLLAHWCRVWAFFFSHIRVDSARFAPTWLLFALSRADLARIKLYWLNRVVSADDRNGRNRPKSILNHAEIAEIGFELGPNPKSILHQFYSEYLLLFLCFLFCFVFVAFFFLCFMNQGIEMYFF